MCSLGHALGELVESETLPCAGTGQGDGTSQVLTDLHRQLGSQVYSELLGNTFTEGFQGRSGGTFGLAPAGQVCPVLHESDELIVFHGPPFSHLAATRWQIRYTLLFKVNVQRRRAEPFRESSTEDNSNKHSSQHLVNPPPTPVGDSDSTTPGKPWWRTDLVDYGGSMDARTKHESDLIKVITDDHREIERAFAEMESGLGTPEYRRQLADHVIADLVRHSVAEEQFMYPDARDALADGDKLVDQEIAEHSEAEQLMKNLEDVQPTDPKFDQTVGALINDVRQHIEEEERSLLPALQAACPEKQLRHLGQKVLLAKDAAPTRPHPSAPDTPPANLILDAGAGLIDKVRDALSGRKT